jgi:FtsP/CotA-like multicopper oxidase with cupredoxin domain
MSVTALNVISGLVGNYIVRDEDEQHLNLPTGRYEVPLTITDDNFETDSHGNLTGELLAKRVLAPSNPSPAPCTIPRSLPFYGPFTIVNGVVWPYLDLEAHRYRFRIVNASANRSYRLVVIDEQTREPMRGVMTLIGTDMGLIGQPQVIDEALSLAPAERADIVIDFAAHPGRRLTHPGSRREHTAPRGDAVSGSSATAYQQAAAAGAIPHFPAAVLLRRSTRRR